MITKSISKNFYKKSRFNDGWKYRKIGTTIIGINENCSQIKTIAFSTIKEMRIEWKKLVGKPLGRPTERKRELTTKKSIL